MFSLVTLKTTLNSPECFLGWWLLRWETVIKSAAYTAVCTQYPVTAPGNMVAGITFFPFFFFFYFLQRSLRLTMVSTYLLYLDLMGGRFQMF